MAAYGALFSLMHLIKQIQEHPYPPISLDNKQVDSLTKNITFLQVFLERYSSSSGSKEDDKLESRIAEAAYAAAEVIESHIVDQIHAGSTSDHGEKICCVDFFQCLPRVIQHIMDQILAGSTSHGETISSIGFYQRLQKVIQDMDLIKKEVMVITKEKTGAQDQLPRNSSVSTASVRPASTRQSSTMVDFGDIVTEVMDKLTGQPDDLQIIPIVGMGGIGKTTLAGNIYANPLIVLHFDFLAWVPISQEYSPREILQVLCQENKRSMESLSQMSEDKLGEKLYKYLWGRRYLIAMDDVWSIEAWDKVKSFFPDNKNGSRIMITTRLSNLDFQLSGSHNFHMKFLDKDKSWNLLREIVFGKGGCPIELEDIGKEIAKHCKGLPLSIVVIGGLLTKSEMTRAYWLYTLGNLNSLINLENNEHCLQILHTSYKELPIHLTPCFLYMGVFPEDDEIRVSKLIKLWVVEGFLKPIQGKSLEVVAKGYFRELIDRNLILVHESRWNGEARLCKIHDLLRDLCLREAQRQRFLCILRQQDLNIPQGINIESRICNHGNSPYSLRFLHAWKPSPSSSSRLLRVYSWSDKPYRYYKISTFEKIIFQQQPDSRYFALEADPLSTFPSSWSLLWSLQILKVVGPVLEPVIAPSEIWKMPQLRHVMFRGLELPDPPSQGDIVLENLQTLSYIYNFRCSEEVVKRIPNVNKLKLCYDWIFEEEMLRNFCLNNLGHLQKLESLTLFFNFRSDSEILKGTLAPNLTFPHSLKTLTLCGTKLYWEDLTTKIGSLPHLEVLKLQMDAGMGPEWETVEGQFCNLKFLVIDWCKGLEYWTTDSTHFPLLEHLVLRDLPSLEEIPSSLGDIPTLESIQLENCRKSAADSAERIKVEQEELGNVGLTVQICNNVLNLPSQSSIFFP